MKRVRVGLVGAGAVASSVHLPILTRRSDLYEVVAIADLNLAATHVLADRFGISRLGFSLHKLSILSLPILFHLLH